MVSNHACLVAATGALSVAVRLSASPATVLALLFVHAATNVSDLVASVNYWFAAF